MDSSVKSVISIFILFVMTLVLTSVVTLSLSFNKVTTLLYSVIQDVEIHGYDEDRIKELASSNNATITVKPVICDDGFQYEVRICFDHIFAFINKAKSLEVKGLTRILQ